MAEEGKIMEANKRIKCEQKDDFISALPDCLIHHILSFLPSTKDAIRTSVLSKRWLNQWTRVPLLIFKSNNGMSIENLSNFIDNALNLYNCSKINKFVIDSNDLPLKGLPSKLTSWIRFAVARDVKELILKQNVVFEPDAQRDKKDQYKLPEFLFNNASLVTLKTSCCLFKPIEGNVNWTSLKALSIGFASLINKRIKNVLSASPVLEYFELRYCSGFKQLAIASKSLKTFRLFGCDWYNHKIEISCPNLEKLQLLGQMPYTTFQLKDLPSSASVTLDFDLSGVGDYDWEWYEKILLQVQHVHELKLGAWFLLILSLSWVPIQQIHLKFSLPEKLVIQLHPRCDFSFSLLSDYAKKGKKLWESDGSIFDYLLSHLKIIEIVGLHHLSDYGNRSYAFGFVEFLLKTASMLEKMVLLESHGQGMILAREVCKKLSCTQKASPRAIVEVACLSTAYFDYDSDWDKIAC